MRFLVLQHIDAEHPGILRDFMAEDGVRWDTVELDEGDEIPPLDGYDAMVVMGGPMDVWDEDVHPWLVPEKAAIVEAVREREMPFLGILPRPPASRGRAGGRGRGHGVGRGRNPRRGADRRRPVRPRARFHPSVLQGVAVARRRGDAAPGGRGGARAFPGHARYRRSGWAIRRSGSSTTWRLTDTTVHEWGVIPEYAAALERTLGAGGLERMQAGATSHMGEFNDNARRLHDAFMAVVRERSPMLR